MSSGRVSNKCAAALAAFLSVPGAARADVLDTTQMVSDTQMMEWCKPIADAVPLPDGNVQFAHTYESGLCWGTFKLLQELGHIPIKVDDGSLSYQKLSFIGACFPDGTAQEIVRMVRVFDAYVRTHEEKKGYWDPVDRGICARAGFSVQMNIAWGVNAPDTGFNILRAAFAGRMEATKPLAEPRAMTPGEGRGQAKAAPRPTRKPSANKSYASRTA